MTAPVPTDERARLEIRSAIHEGFGSRTSLAEVYADFLCAAGIDRGVLGPREAGQVWERHLLNSAALAPLIPEGARVIDLGSGAGLPGIPLAIARPDLVMVLLEPMTRRVKFLHDCLELLALPNTSVHHGRAESGITARADVVVVRAVASLDKLLRLSAPLLLEDGTLLALKGASAAEELAQVQHEATLDAEMLSVSAPGRPATVIRVRSHPTPAIAPKRGARDGDR